MGVLTRDRPRHDVLSALLRCGSCRYIAFYFLPFYVALVDRGAATWGWAAFGVAFWGLYSFGIELLNRITDATEDRVNRPERTAFCDIVGYTRILLLTRAIWVVIGAITLAWIWIRPNPMLIFFALSGLFWGINYSVGFRFKERRLFCHAVLTIPSFGPLSLGWWATSSLQITGDVIGDFLTRILPLIVVLMLFIASIVGAKDLGDIAGDARIGYRSLYVEFIDSYGVWLIGGLVLVPFAAVALFSRSGLLPPRFLWLLVFAPISMTFAMALAGARTKADSEAIRELMYHDWFLFTAVALALAVPTWPTMVAIVGSGAYWLVCSQRFHWSDGVRVWKVRRFVASASRELFEHAPRRASL